MIRLTPPQLKAIEAAAEAAFPAESCGLLAGRKTGGETTVTRLHPSPNIAKTEKGAGNDRFEVDPKVRFDLMRKLEGTDESIIGHYHSHPGQAPEPSEHDLDMAFEPQMVWLITTVDDKGHAGETLAWRLDRESRSIDVISLEIGDLEGGGG